MKAVFVFLLFVSLIVAQTILKIGGTTCIPDEADSCTPREGSTRIELVGGVNVADDECAAGSANTWGVGAEFTTETEGFFTVSLRGLGENENSAVLIFEGEPTADAPCDAVVATSDSWNGYMPAGTWTAVVTSNNGEEGACGEFGVTVTQTVYEFTGVTDTEITPVSAFGGFCSILPDNIWVHLLTFTPEEDGAYLASGVGRQDDADTGFVTPSFIVPSASLSGNLTNGTMNCEMAADFIAFDTTELGYVLEAGVEYTIALYDFDTAGEIMVWANVVRNVPFVWPDCDNMDYDDQVNFLRPSIPSTSITTECVEGTAEHQFDVRVTSFETDQFVVVDTVNCGNPDETRSNVDGAVVLYYGEVGTPRDGDTPAVAPEDPCEDFIIAGDSGDGGAVFYWFPAEAPLTIVPTTWSSSGSGVYTLTVDSYDIVGCVPENPFLPEPEPADASYVLTFVASALIFIALL